jgi:MFS family permease
VLYSLVYTLVPSALQTSDPAQLVTAVTIWNVGYVLGQIPINLALTRIAPRWIIPTVSAAPPPLSCGGAGGRQDTLEASRLTHQLILIWGVATLATYSIKNVTHLYVCRFFVGLFE